MALDPASIRTNNPGAQWFGPIARMFGATGAENLPGGNNAAIFDDPVNGAAAQFALWGKSYTGMPLSAAISKWSGGNSSPAYVDFLEKRTGISPDTVITPELLAGPKGVALAKAQARWEAGRDYPLTDNQWTAAQSKAFGGAPTAVADSSSAPAPSIPASPVAIASAAPAGAPGGQAPGASSSMGMLSGADLTGQGSPSGGSALGMLAQKMLASAQPQMPAPPPISYPIPAALRARLAAAALGQG